MELKGNNHGFEGELPKERVAFEIMSNAKMFSILSDGIYKDKIMAVIRELCCNAFDAHIAAGKKGVPFVITFPSRYETTFSVADVGTGIDPSKIGGIFWTYGASTKSNSNEFIGALGLGSKSPFAYTKSSFIVKNRYEGNEYVYLCFINEQGTPEGSLVSTTPTTESSGITVEFAVRTGNNGNDSPAFIDRAQRFFRYWQGTLPEIKGIDSTRIFNDSMRINKVMEGKEWFLEDRSHLDVEHNGAIAMMGNVPYPIDADAIPNMPVSLRTVARNPFVITFPMGSISFTASRESLEYSNFTNKAVIARLEEVRAEIATTFHNDVFKKSKTHLEFVRNFSTAFSAFRNTVTCYNEDGNAVSDVNDFVGLLLGKEQEDEILFRGHKFGIKGLIEADFDITYDGHEIFGLYQIGSKGRRNSVVLDRSHITYVAKEEFPGDELYTADQWQSKNKIDEDEEFDFKWRARYVGPRSEAKSLHDRLFRTKRKFEVTTRTSFPIPTADNSSLTFIINDCGSTGQARFKMLDGSSIHQKILVDFHVKQTTVAAVQKSLDELIKSGLEGSKVVLLSTLPDLRPAIAKVKNAAGSVKLRTSTTTSFKNIEREISFGRHVVKAKVHYFQLSGTDEKMFMVADLKTAPILFVIKKRTEKHVYDDLGGRDKSIISSADVMSYATHLGFFDGYYGVNKTESLPVFKLTVGQHAWLLKKGVTMVNPRDIIKDKITALAEVEKFSDHIEEIIGMSKVKSLTELYERVDAKKMSDIASSQTDSMFKQYLTQLYALKQAKDPKIVDSFIKLSVHQSVKYDRVDLGQKRAEEIADKMDKAYPMLAFVNYYNPHSRRSSIKTVMEYLDECDAKLVAKTTKVEA